MPRLFLKDAAAGDVLEDVFVITNKQLAATSTGKFYIKAFLSDRTAQVTTRMWNATRDIFAAIPESGFLRVRGRVENFQNNLQIIIEQMWAARSDEFDAADLIPHTRKNIPAMSARVVALLGTIRNRHLSAIMRAFLDDKKLMADFCKAPAAMSFHHAFLGGLLEHTLNSMEVAEGLVKFYPGLSRDLVMAGIFLHDIAKTWELSYECSFGYTDGGQLVGHIVKAAMWVEEKAAVAEKTLGEKIPRALVESLEHIILSHHGEPEFGAARVPCTPEALVVHAVENLDAKLMIALGATRGDLAPGAEGNWTEYLKAFGVRMYRPDPALADDAAASADPVVDRDEPSSAVPTMKVELTNPLFHNDPPRHG